MVPKEVTVEVEDTGQVVAMDQAAVVMITTVEDMVGSD